MITIINYNLGNLNSIANMLRKIGYDCEITGDAEKIQKAKKLILPGVGAFDHGIKNLYDLRLIDVLKAKVLEEKIPILGICLGMQLMTKSSEEGVLSGLGFINAATKKFVLASNYKIPHMGWNTIEIKKKSTLTSNMEHEENRFYFVHSYYVHCEQESDILATTHYGIDFVSMFEHDNIFGAQFHPEKSHKFGMQLLKNFGEL